MNIEQRNELLQQMLETEMGGVQVLPNCPYLCAER